MDTSTFNIDSIRYNTKFQKKLLDRLDIKESKEFGRLVHSVQQTTTRIWKKANFEIGDRVRISKYDLPFRTSYNPQFSKEVFGFVAISPR